MLQKIVIMFLLLMSLASNLYATDPEIYYEQAQTAFQKEEYDDASELFEKYLTFAPDSELAAEAWYSIGECRYKQENYPEALLSYQAAIALYPDSSFVPKAYNKIGDCYWRIDDREKACQSYNQTIKELTIPILFFRYKISMKSKSFSWLVSIINVPLVMVIHVK